jgi:hypothetical protein
MSSRTKLPSILLLCALVLSLIPAATLVQPAAAISTCDWAQFISDVTVPDGTRYAPGTAFQKTWRLKNIGTCTWTTAYSLVFDSGDRFGAQDVNFPINVAPGQTVDLTLNMTSPSAVGHYFSYWRLRNASGVIFGIGSTANRSFWAEINVTTGGTTGVAYDFTANAASAAWSSGAGGLTFPGTDGSASGFALPQSAPKFESGVTFPQPGMLFAPNNFTNGYIQAVYPAFRVQSGDRFQATIGCELSATSCYVAYRLDYQIGSGPVRTFWTFREKWEGLTYPANLNLSSLAGFDVKFILVVSAFGTPVGDRALWGNPVIARVGANPPPTVTGTPPTATPTKPVPAACDRALFIADVTIPDGTSIAPNFTFTKTWRLKNVGTCTWAKDSYKLMFDSGEKMSGPDTAPMPVNVPPGSTVDITVTLTSPNVAGLYRGYWKFQNGSGVPFGIGLGGTKAWWVEIKVAGTGIVPSTATPSITLTPSATSTATATATATATLTPSATATVTNTPVTPAP